MHSAHPGSVPAEAFRKSTSNLKIEDLSLKGGRYYVALMNLSDEKVTGKVLVSVQ